MLTLPEPQSAFCDPLERFYLIQNIWRPFLHAHLIICDPAPTESVPAQNDKILVCSLSPVAYCSGRSCSESNNNFHKQLVSDLWACPKSVLPHHPHSEWMRLPALTNAASWPVLRTGLAVRAKSIWCYAHDSCSIARNLLASASHSNVSNVPCSLFSFCQAFRFHPTHTDVSVQSQRYTVQYFPVVTPFPCAPQLSAMQFNWS